MGQDKHISVGLDIGTTKVCCVIGQHSDKDSDLKLLGIGTSSSSGMRTGKVINIDDTVNAIISAVQNAEKMANVKVDNAFVGISGDHVRGINTQGAIAVTKNGHHIVNQHEITGADITRVLEMSKAISLPMDRDILHILPKEYVVDEQGGIKDPLGMSGRRLEAKVHLITGGVAASKNIIKCAEEAGIAVNALIFQPLAAATSALESHEKESGVVLVDIGGGTTDVAVFFDGAIQHSAVINLAGYSITNDIAMLLKRSIDDAEEIKIKFASAKASMASTDLEIELPSGSNGTTHAISEHEISRYAEARMMEILKLVKREINRADVNNFVSFGVVITGGGALMKNIVSLAEEIFEAPVKIGYPKGASGVNDIAASPIYSTAVGLIQYGPTVEKEFNLGTERESMTNHMVQRVKHWFETLF